METFGETFPITKENIAAMLALIGKEEQNTSSPTAIVMLSNLKDNLKILFEKICRKELEFAMVRLGKGVQLDAVFYEYAKVGKETKVSKVEALANCLNVIQQTHGNRHLNVIAQDESSEAFEFLIEVRDF